MHSFKDKSDNWLIPKKTKKVSRNRNQSQKKYFNKGTWKIFHLEIYIKHLQYSLIFLLISAESSTESDQDDNFIVVENSLTKSKINNAKKAPKVKYTFQNIPQHLPYVVHPLVRSLGFPLLNLPLHTPTYYNLV